MYLFQVLVNARHAKVQKGWEERSTVFKELQFAQICTIHYVTEGCKEGTIVSVENLTVICNT